MSVTQQETTANPDPAALAFAQRAQDLMQNNPGLDHQTVISLAQSSQSDQQLADTAQSVQSTLASQWNGYEHALSDPVLTSAPSTAQAVAAYVHQTIGPPPVASGTITQLQQALVADGILKPNQVSGVWDSASEAGYNQAVNNYKQETLAGGNRPLSAKVSSVINTVGHIATHPWDIAIGWAQGVRQAIGDAGGAFEAMGTGHFTGTSGSTAFNADSARIINALGGNATSASQKKVLSNPINAAGDVASLTGVGGVAKSTLKGALEQIGTNVAKETAEQATERLTLAASTEPAQQAANLARMQKVQDALSASQRLGFAGRSINDIGNALRAGVLPASDPLVQRNLGVITKSLLRLPAKLTGEVDTLPDLNMPSWRGNFPSLARMAPVAAVRQAAAPLARGIAAGADDGGWAYKIRNAVATPYRNPVVRAVGVANSRAQIGAFTGAAVAAALPGSQLNKDVFAARTPGLDSWLDNTTWNPIPGVSIGPEDLLLGPIHGDVAGAGKASAVVGQSVSAFSNKLADALGKTGAGAAVEDATGMSREDLIKAAGSETNLHMWINSHMNQAAEDKWIQLGLGHNATMVPGDDADIASLRSQWQELPGDQKQAQYAKFAAADTHVQFLKNHLDSDFLHSALTAEARQSATKSDMASFFGGQAAASDLVQSGAAHYLIGPKGAAILREDANGRAFGGDLETPPATLPNINRNEYIQQGMSHVKAINGHIDTMLAKTGKTLTDAQTKLAAASTDGEKFGAGAAVRAAQEKHDAAMEAVGRVAPERIQAAQDEVTRRQAAALAAKPGTPEHVAAQTYLRGAQNNLSDLQKARTQMSPTKLLGATARDGGAHPLKSETDLANQMKSRMVKLRDLVSNSVPEDEVDQELRNSINGEHRFDTLYTRQHGPGQALPPGFGSADYAHLSNPEQPGSVGFMSVNRVDRSQAQAAGAKFQAAWQAAKTPADIAKVNADIINYMGKEFGVTASRLLSFGGDTNALLERFNQQAEKLAAPAQPTWDQPAWAKAKMDAVNKAGYKVVIGDHIGQHLDGTLPQIAAIDGWKTPIKQWMGKVGLDPSRVPDTEVTKATKINRLSQVHKALVNDPKMVLTTAHADARTVLQVMDYGIHTELNPVASALFNATRRVGMNKTEIEQIAKTQFGGDADALVKARHELEDQMANKSGIRERSDKVVREALTTTHEVKTPDGTFMWNAVDNYTATKLIHANAQGYRLPGYMMGGQMIENWARSRYGVPFASKLIERNPDNTLIQAVAHWPNKLVQARNQLRFGMSPIFDIRRTVKQDYKMALEGVHGAGVNPLQKMLDNGDLDQAAQRWQKVTGQKVTDQMKGDQYLNGRSITGLYSPEYHGMYFVNEKMKQGASASEAKEAYDRVFKYGSQGGRTALERTANTIFFPFSFEKTLLRNTAGYLLDKPGQALALDVGVEAWRKADQNGQVGQWVDAHLPLLKEMQTFNAFSHGISPGQFGGINAPIIGAIGKGASTAVADVNHPGGATGKSEALLNLFLPQSWGVNGTAKNYAKYMPVWNQLSEILSSAADQTKILDAAAHDTVNSVLNKGWRPQPTLTSYAQQHQATQQKAEMVSSPQWSAVLDYNAHQSTDADKYLWPSNTNQLPASMWGEPISKSTISQYMQWLYPAYDPAAGVAEAVTDKSAVHSFIENIGVQDPAKAAAMQSFVTEADKVIGHINDDSYDPATIAVTQNEFQQYAQTMARTDPQWGQLYNNWFGYALGPIKSPNGKKAL